MSLKAEVVAHWKRMREDAPGVFVTNKAEMPSGTDCAYCEEYHRIICGGVNCTDCPVFASTGEHGCAGTPFNDAKEAWTEYRNSKWDESQRDWWQLKADLMIRFIEGLPDGE